MAQFVEIVARDLHDAVTAGRLDALNYSAAAS